LTGVRIGRVRTRARFAALSATGRRARRGVLRVTAVPGEPGDLACVAYAVSRAVGPAVVRNRVRRRLRAAATELAPVPGTYLVAADPEAAGRSYVELRNDLAAALTALDALPRPVVAR
jgi:ribonuclease P protein component